MSPSKGSGTLNGKHWPKEAVLLSSLSLGQACVWAVCCGAEVQGLWETLRCFKIYEKTKGRNWLDLCTVNVFGKGLRGPQRLWFSSRRLSVCLPGMGLPWWRSFPGKVIWKYVVKAGPILLVFVLMCIFPSEQSKRNVFSDLHSAVSFLLTTVRQRGRGGGQSQV